MRLSNPLKKGVRVYWWVDPVSRLHGYDDDFRRVYGLVRFAAGETDKTFEIAVVDDTKVEGNERVLVTAFVYRDDDDGLVDYADAEAWLTIADNDLATVSIEPTVSVPEGGTAALNMELAAAADADVSVSWSTVESTAAADTDYTSQAATTVTFAPGETRKTITVQTMQDDVVEQQEEFKVRLAPVSSNATLTTTEATVHIVDDDSDSVFTLLGPPGPVAEEARRSLRWSGRRQPRSRRG